MSKFTPGPWYIQDDLIRGDFGYVADIRGGLITEANARLIAAAPDLLEAIKLIYKKKPQLVSREEAADMACEFWIIAGEALAKAEGK